MEPVREGDFRTDLKPGIDVTVYTDKPIAKGTILGMYRNMTVTKREEGLLKDDPPQDFGGTRNEWCQKLDAYTADIEPPSVGTRSWKQFSYIYDDVLEVYFVFAVHAKC